MVHGFNDLCEVVLLEYVEEYYGDVTRFPTVRGSVSTFRDVRRQPPLLGNVGNDTTTVYRTAT